LIILGRILPLLVYITEDAIPALKSSNASTSITFWNKTICISNGGCNKAGIKEFESVKRTTRGVEVIQMIKKNQVKNSK
jgi:hypothetical protein